MPIDSLTAASYPPPLPQQHECQRLAHDDVVEESAPTDSPASGNWRVKTKSSALDWQRCRPLGGYGRAGCLLTGSTIGIC